MRPPLELLKEQTSELSVNGANRIQASSLCSVVSQDDEESQRIERLLIELLGDPGEAEPSPSAALPSPRPAPSPAVVPTAGQAWPTAKLIQPGISFSSLPHRQWLYGADLVRGEITVLASPGGIGKSSLALAITVSMATGQELLGTSIYGNNLKALYINAEDSRTEMLRRLWALCLEHGLAEQDLARMCLLGVDNWQVQRLSFLWTERGASVLHQAAVEHLGSMLDEFRPDVVVLDPLVSLCAGGNMNDNAAMSLVMRAIKELAIRYNCSFLVIHHTKKGGDLHSSEAIGGAVAIVNLARRALMLVGMSQDEAKKLAVLPSKRWRYFRLLSAKANLAPPASDDEWYELRSVELPNPEPPTYPHGDGVQAIAKATLSAGGGNSGVDMSSVEKAVLEVVDAGKLVGGTRVPYSPNKTGAANARGLTDDALAAIRQAVGLQTSPADLLAVLDQAISNLKVSGGLVEAEIESGRFRRGRGLSVDWGNTPWAAEHADKSAENDDESSAMDDAVAEAEEAPALPEAVS